MTRPDYIHCISKTGKGKPSWCGVDHGMIEPFFASIEHVKATEAHGSRLLPCPKCLALQALAKINVEYMTKEINKSGPGWVQYCNKTTEITPIQFYRRPCGSGAARNRYFYSVLFTAPDDAYYNHDGKILANVDRKLNPLFNPKKLTWVDNAAMPLGVGRS